MYISPPHVCIVNNMNHFHAQRYDGMIACISAEEGLQHAAERVIRNL